LIGPAGPGRPIGPWSRRTGAPQASATTRDRFHLRRPPPALSGSTERASPKAVVAPARPLAGRVRLPRRGRHRPPSNLAGGRRRHPSAIHPHCATRVSPAPSQQTRPESVELRSRPGRCSADAQVLGRFYGEAPVAAWSSRESVAHRQLPGCRLRLRQGQRRPTPFRRGRRSRAAFDGNSSPMCHCENGHGPSACSLPPMRAFRYRNQQTGGAGKDAVGT
jgi:hypothetical protein